MLYATRHVIHRMPGVRVHQPGAAVACAARLVLCGPVPAFVLAQARAQAAPRLGAPLQD